MPAIHENQTSIVVGVDVGGEKKGFHAVALQDGAFFGKKASQDAAEIADWCRELGALCVGVDAPCRWSNDGKARPAERALMREGIHCFATPSRAAAENHPRHYFHWMVNGSSLFAHLEVTYKLFTGQAITPPLCFETFPQAIACVLSGQLVSAREKRTVRRALLEKAGVDVRSLSNMDLLDAALCSLAAHHLMRGQWHAYGVADSGFIVVPRLVGAVS